MWLIKELTMKEFEVKDWTYDIRGSKQVSLEGKEDLKQLQDVAERMILAS